MRGRSGVAALVCIAGLALSAPSLAAPLTLYRSLVASKYGNSELPKGFSKAQVIPDTVTAAARSSDLVVGALQVTVAGPDPDDVILYAVYKTPAAAKHAFDHAVSANSGYKLHFAGRVPGVAEPTAMYVGSTENPYGTVGVSIAGALEGNVVVSVLTSARKVNGGNTRGTQALLRSGVRHLDGLVSNRA